MFSLDLKDAYFQILICPIQDAILNHAVFQFKVLCFRLSTSPSVFTRMFMLVSWGYWMGICVFHYLRDLLVVVDSNPHS